MPRSTSLSSNVRTAVLRNYEQWKGKPSRILSPPQPNPWVDPRFGVLVYHDPRGYVVCATAGASAHIQPHSELTFSETGGVRCEYLMHGKASDVTTICDILDIVTMYPFSPQVHQAFEAGSCIPLGPESQAALGGTMTHIYLTYPYEDDARIYTSSTWGQIKTPDFLVQTLWVIPLHPAEAALIATNGPDSFEALCTPGMFSAFNWQRPSLVEC